MNIRMPKKIENENCFLMGSIGNLFVLCYDFKRMKFYTLDETLNLRSVRKIEFQPAKNRLIIIYDKGDIKYINYDDVITVLPIEDPSPTFDGVAAFITDIKRRWRPINGDGRYKYRSNEGGDNDPDEYENNNDDDILEIKKF